MTDQDTKEAKELLAQIFVKMEVENESLNQKAATIFTLMDATPRIVQNIQVLPIPKPKDEKKEGAKEASETKA